MRKKKTPEELAAEAEAEDVDELTSKFHDSTTWQIYFFLFASLQYKRTVFTVFGNHLKLTLTYFDCRHIQSARFL